MIYFIMTHLREAIEEHQVIIQWIFEGASAPREFAMRTKTP